MVYKVQLEYRKSEKGREREKEREREREVEGRRPSAGGDVEEEEPWCAMAPMAVRKSWSERSGSGGGDGRRGYRRPLALHRHCPVTVWALVVVVVFPIGQALPWIRSGLWERVVAAVNIGSRASAPSRSFYRAGDGGPPAIT